MPVPSMDELSAAPEDAEGGSWMERHKGAATAAALAGASLLARRPIGRALGGAVKAMPEVPLASQLGRGVQGMFAPTSLADPANLARRTPGGTGGAMALTTPESTTAREAEALVRQHEGRAARATDAATAGLEPHWKNLGMRSVEDKDKLVNYIETRSQGAKIHDPALQPAADAIRKAYERVRSEMQGLDKTGRMGFIEDYYRHMYKPKEGEAPGAFAGKLGSGSFTKERTIPTIQEAMKHGYEPITHDPIEMTMRYVQNAERFIARENILKQAKSQNLLYSSNKADHRPMEGWEAIYKKGPNTFYAPKGFAQVWNNFTSKGVTGPMKDVYEPMQHGFNMLTGLELGLSGFHATTMALEGVISETARAIQQAMGGSGGALKTLVRAPVAPVHLWKTGKDVEKAWLGQSPGTAHMQRIVNLMEKGGGRAKPYLTSEEYKFSGAGSFLEAARRGALKAQLEADRVALGSGVAPAAKTVLKNIGRVFDTVAEPLFQRYIPRLKNGAFYETMSTWLQNNPKATVAAQEQAARRILDSIDNRFGEVIHDNIFWNKALKQASTLMMRSYSWNLGTIREIAGGVKDIGAGEIDSARAAYVMALPLVLGMVNAVYQGIKTGKPPESEQDLIAPRTGGIDPATGLPERLALLGYAKDVYGWYKDPIQEAKNKIATGPSLIGQAATGQDWKGDPIAPPDANAPEHVKAYAKHIGEAFVPLSIKSIYEGHKRGSGMTAVESLMGFRPAGRDLVDPEGAKAMKDKREQQAWKRKTKRDIRQESYYGTGED